MSQYKKNIEPELRVLLPQKVIDFLWKITLSDEHKDADQQTFILVPGRESGDVQWIAHSYYRPNMRKWYHFPLTKPLQCSIAVNYDNTGYSMVQV